MEKFKESLSKMVGLNRLPRGISGIYTLKDLTGVEQSRFSCGHILTMARSEKTWMINISDMYGHRCVGWDVKGGTTVSVYKGLSEYNTEEFVTVSDFFLDPSSPYRGEINLFATAHPWAVSAINTLADVIFKEHEDPPEIRAANYNNRN